MSKRFNVHDLILQNKSVSNADLFAIPEREKGLRPILSRFNDENQFTTTSFQERKDAANPAEHGDWIINVV
jgi:hypothetical protein